MKREDFVTCVQVLTALLHADDEFSEGEQRFLDRTMTQMNFSSEERVQACLPMDEAARTAAIEGLPKPVIGGLLQSLIQGAMIDGVDERERAFVNRLGVSVGADEETLAFMWERAERGED